MRDRAALAERIWLGADGVARAARALLLPAERLFGGVVGARDVLYDAGWLRSHDVALPAISVGNLTVGGTGKTPIAAWIASELLIRGMQPAIVLRGYGDDEPLVHKILNPSIPIVLNADRVAGVAEAARRGADIAVLDDAFQHRRARRRADLVLISADRWTGEERLLPAGPWREPLSAVRRASLAVVTRKAAGAAAVDAVYHRLSEVAPAVPRVAIHLAPDVLVHAAPLPSTDASSATSATSAERKASGAGVGAATRPLESLAGRSVHAILSIADPTAFVGQLEALGARVRCSVFPDHHVFTAREIAELLQRVDTSETVVCTLKDAVKLAPLWPRLGPGLWYVSQRVVVERGIGGLEHILDELAHTPSTRTHQPG